MKLKMSTGRKLKYGGTSIAITALVLALVIIVNLIFALFVQRFSLYIDLTPDYHFTISDECYELIGGSAKNSPINMVKHFRFVNEWCNKEYKLTPDMPNYRDENVKINILFCLERDVLLAEETSEYVVRNAEELKTKFPEYISVEFVDSRRNPSRFTKYLSSNTETIDRESVIIECGAEYRINSLRSFYRFNEAGEPFAYNGEKTLASSILAVTRSESPLACYTTNHGESFPEGTANENGKLEAPFLNALKDAGYRTQALDLSREEIPEECRLMIVYDPKHDFISGKDGSGAQSELDKLDDYLANKNALMVFMNPDAYDGAKGLENLEEFLAEWGLAFRRDGADPYLVRDEVNSILGDSSVLESVYAENDLSAGWTSSITSGAGEAKQVAIPNGAAITYADGYPLGHSSTFNRTVYDLLVSSDTAKAFAGDREIAAATKADPLKLMAVSVQVYSEQEYLGSTEDFAYVMLCGSTDFGSSEYLDSKAFGNGDFMLSAFQMSGREPVAVGLEFKQFADYEIKTITSGDATRYMIILTLVPVLISLCAGVFVIVRRKNR